MRVLFSVVIVFATINLKAQVSGRVLEFSELGKNEPISGANIYWEGTAVGTVTDALGNYIIDNAPSFPATLNVSFVGYELEYKEVVDDKYIFYLKNSIALDEVEVKGNLNTTRISTLEPIVTQILSKSEIQKAACCNLSECFETNNSVDVSYSDAISGIKRIQMLGLDGNYLKVTNELFPLVRGLQRSYGFSYVPGSWIESIQIIKGPGSVVNGHESFTGHINVEYLKPDESDKLNLNLYVNGSGKIENNLIVSKSTGKWKSNLFTHISYFDREIDKHGYFHDHSDHKGDKFLDMPKFKQFGLLNRWQYSDEKYRSIIFVRAFLEDRSGGQVQSDYTISNPYLFNVNNEIIQLYTKIGNIINDKQSVGTQTSLTLHNQSAQFGSNIYSGKQESIFFNFIYQNQITESDLFKYGFSYSADRFLESFDGRINKAFDLVKRVDLVSGIFSEHQYTSNRFTIITGLRGDYYNIKKKVYISPRFNMKYNSSEQTTIRVSIGKAFRISNVLSENLYYLASSRDIVINDSLNPEVAWNYGVNFSYCFYLLNKEGALSLDIYRTVFQNQVVKNIEHKDYLIFDNLNGSSFSNTIQLDFDYKLISNLDIRFGYKYNDVLATYDGEEKEIPLSPKQRGLINFSYKTNSDRWHLDFTTNYIGRSRMPENLDSEDFSSSFFIFNSQLTYKKKNFDIYFGSENIGDYTQPNPIVDSENPFGDDFDASLIWGPVMGRTIYSGIRYKIK